MGILIIVIVFASFITGYFASQITRPALGESKKEALPPVKIEIPVEGDFDFVKLEPMAPAPAFVKWEEIPIFETPSEEELQEKQLRSEIINGDLWGAVETFKTLKELGTDPALSEFITVLQEFPAWDWKVIAPEKALKEYSPLGTAENIKKEAARLFLRMAVHNYRRSNLLLTAAFIEAAYISLHEKVKMEYFSMLRSTLHHPFREAPAAGALSCVWSYNY